VKDNYFSLCKSPQTFYLYCNISAENGSKTAEANRENVISHFMKSRFLTIIILVIAKLATSQNASILMGHWQYFDNKNVYHEIVMEKSRGYIIGDSLDPAMFSVIVDTTSAIADVSSVILPIKNVRFH
jgi:hypothetical protein